MTANGSFEAGVAEVERGDVDFAIGAFFHNSARTRRVDPFLVLQVGHGRVALRWLDSRHKRTHTHLCSRDQ